MKLATVNPQLDFDNLANLRVEDVSLEISWPVKTNQNSAYNACND